MNYSLIINLLLFCIINAFAVQFDFETLLQQNKNPVFERIRKNIVNGNPTTTKKWPWMASLRLQFHTYPLKSDSLLNFAAVENKAWDYSWFFCGGSLIRNTYPAVVLTAAHCVEGISNYLHFSTFVVNFGVNDVDGIQFGQYEEEFQVFNYITHPDYNNYTMDNDIALLYLKGSTERKIVTLGQPTDYQNLTTDDWLTIIGYGLDKEDGVLTDTLEFAFVQYLDNVDCETQVLKYLLQIENGSLKDGKFIDWTMYDFVSEDDNKICSHMLNTSSCQGDSGGPIIVGRDHNGIQVGLTSYGYECGSLAPVIYTNVCSYHKWIQNALYISEPKSTDIEPISTSNSYYQFPELSLTTTLIVLAVYLFFGNIFSL